MKNYKFADNLVPNYAFLSDFKLFISISCFSKTTKRKMTVKYVFGLEFESWNPFCERAVREDTATP